MAWHIRTVDPGERARDYNASVHTYMITEPSPVVCSTFEEATVDIQASRSSLLPEDLYIFISANRFVTSAVLGIQRVRRNSSLHLYVK